KAEPSEPATSSLVTCCHRQPCWSVEELAPLAQRSAPTATARRPRRRRRVGVVSYPPFRRRLPPGSAIHPLGGLCRVGGDARRLFVDVDLAAAADRADLEPGRSADAGGTHAAPRSARTDREQVLPAEAISTYRR